MTTHGYAVMQDVSVLLDPMATLYDSFSGDELNATLWDTLPIGSGGSKSFSSGLVLAASSSELGGYAVFSHSSYDMTGRYALVNATATSTSSIEKALYLTCVNAAGTNIGEGTDVPAADYDMPYVRMALTSGSLTASYSAEEGGDFWSASWSDSLAWWRIREDSGTFYFDTASDGITWTNQATLADSAVFAGGGSLTSMYASLEVFNWSGGSASDLSTTFANFNLPPDVTPPSPYSGSVVTSSAVVLNSDDSVNTVLPSVTASFNYGDTSEDIRQAVRAAVQAAAGDDSLEVEIISG